MAPKMMEDADGDTPPCSVIEDYSAAKEWDLWKQQTYKGKQKAKPTTKEFHPFRYFCCLWIWLKKLN